MKLTLPEIHASLRDTLRRLAAERIAPQVEAIENEGVSSELVALLAELDLWGIALPEEKGGTGLDALAFVLVVEDLAAVSPSLAHCYGMHAGPASAVLATTELDLSAVAEGGLASWSEGGLAPAASSFLVTTTDDGAEVRRGATATPVRTTGLRGAGLATHAGGEVVASSTESGRRWADLSVAAGCLGAGRGALQAALTYAQDRKQFKRPIASFQAIQLKLADAAMLVDATELMVWRAAMDADPTRAAAARTFAARMIREVASEALQIHGGYGYTREYPVERFLRAGRQWTATPDAARSVVAHGALGT